MPKGYNRRFLRTGLAHGVCAVIVLEDAGGFAREHGGCAATIGKFDGVHLGHQLIIGQVVEQAKTLGLPALAVVIEPHPEEFFAGLAGGDCPARLMGLAEKLRLLEAHGVDCCLVLGFDQAMSQTSAADYIRRILVDGLGVAALVIGGDFRFGRGREGDFALLEARGRAFGFSVHRALDRVVDGCRVSSTAVREALAAGDFHRAGRLLGRPYAIRGPVIRGEQLGAKLGYPTCNIELPGRRIPLHGIYAGEAVVAGRAHPAAVSVGFRPTVEDAGKPLLEAYLLDFEGDLYGETIEVIFRQKLRDEEKFDSLETLRGRIADDVARVRQVLNSAKKP